MALLCSLAAATAAIGALLMPFPAQQHAPPAPAAATTELASVQDAPSDTEPAQGDVFGPAAEAAQLEEARGGTDTATTTNNMNVNGTVAGNTATNVITGTNTISAGAFTDASGIPMVIQNTGSNVLIQNATIINLRMQ